MCNFNQLLNEFFKFKFLRPESKNNYRKIVNYFCNSHIDLEPDYITTDNILYWREEMLNKIKPVSWNTYVRHLKSLINFGIKKNILKRKDNPFEGMNIKHDIKKIKCFSSNQIFLIDDYISNLKYNDKNYFDQPRWFFNSLINTFKFTGIRKKQLLNLKVNSLNMHEGLIMINGEYNKNHNSHIIPIPSKLKPCLIDLLKKHDTLGYNSDEQLFNINKFNTRKNQNKTMSSHQIDAIFKSLSKELGFQVSSHRFRHTLATNILKNSNNIYLAQKILGHQSINTTMQYIGNDLEILRTGLENL